MKKASLLSFLAFAAISASAQLTLSTSPYTQNFNGITSTSGLPAGWAIYNSATATSLGLIQSWSASTNYGRYADTLNCPSDVYGGGAKYYPSANNGNAAKVASCSAQTSFTDRAFGIKQVSQTNASNPNLEPGAAFVLKITNTTGLSNLNLSFKLQSLDTTTPRTTTWTVDYATGAAPTAFTPATAVGTLTTGNLLFSNNTVTVNFGSALDNKTTNVWIRIAALTATTGTGSRAATAIDDVNLTWTGTSSVVSAVASLPATSLVVLGNSSADKVTFGYNVEETGNYSFSIYDLTGRIIRTETVAAKSGDQQLTVSGLNLSTGLYIAKMNNSNSSAVAKFTVN
jgi:hypothetical protein